MNYLDCLSRWIGNLGVVPLFLLAAFLLVPIFDFLFFLIALSCFVFDAINLPSIFRFIKITYLTCFVKMVFMFPALCLASNTRLISKGEQIQMSALKLQSYSLGNHQILTTKIMKRKKMLYLKGKSIGYTDLIIWRNNGKKEHFHIYVLSKREGLKLAQIAKSFEAINLKISFKGKLLEISGELQDSQQFRDYLKLKKKYNDFLIDRTSKNKHLSFKIIESIYKTMMLYKVEDYKCYHETELRCSYKSFEKNIALEKNILEQTGLKVQYYLKDQFLKNHILNLKLIEIERSDGQEFSLGLQELSSSVGKILSRGPIDLISRNSIKIANHKYQLSTIAQPSISLAINSKGKLRLGSSTPFTTSSSEHISTTNWKDTGFSMDYIVKPSQEKLVLEYKIDLTHFQSKDIQGGAYQGSHFLRMDVGFKPLFNIAMYSEGKKKQRLPLLGKIPVLGLIFQSNQNHQTYKSIMAFYTFRSN